MVFRGNIEKLTLKNNFYRKVINTTNNMQLVLMSLKPEQEIGMEIHKKTSQFIRVESGKARAIIGTKKYILKAHDAIIIEPNSKHNIINIGDEPLKLYTIYTPPEHPKNTKQYNKLD